MKPKSFTVKTDVSPFSIFEVTTKQYRPWLDFQDGKNVLFTSVHLFDNVEESSESNSDLPQKSEFRSIFYPGTGSADENTKQFDTQHDFYPGGILNVPIKPGDASASHWRK